LKNSEIEKLVFEDFLKVTNLEVTDIVYSDHPDVKFNFENKKIGVELSELLDERDQEEIKIIKSGLQAPGYSFDPMDISKIEMSLKKKKEKDYSLPGHEIWLVLYTNHVGMPLIDHFSEISEKIERLFIKFLEQKKDLNRVMIFEKHLKKIVVDVSRD
jgi:hypothetical protein